MRSAVRNRNGPLPVGSVICALASVLAMRSGMITQFGCASATGTSANGFFSRMRMTRSDGADTSSVRLIIALPNASRWPQRRMHATQSRASTFSPSWKRRPSRSVSSQVRPSFSTLWPSTICGCGWKFASRPYSRS